MALFDLTADTNVRKLMVLNPDFPKDVEATVIKGNTTSATFAVEIAEHGTPAEYSYQWYVNDTPVEGATEATYERTGLTETETLTVYCDVTNKKGTVRSRTATLNVTQYYLPVLNSSYPQNVTVEKGKSVTSKVTIDTAGNPDSYTYQWYKNGSAVSGATNASYTYTPSAVGKTTLYCKVTNAAGTVTSRTATITAIYTVIPGTFFDSLKVDDGNKQVYENSNGSFTFHNQHGCNFKKAINVSNYSKMTLKGTKSWFKGKVYVGLFNSSSSDSLITGFKYTKYENETFDKTYDISNVSGTVYLGVHGTYTSDDGEHIQCYVTISSIVFQ